MPFSMWAGTGTAPGFNHSKVQQKHLNANFAAVRSGQ